MNAHPRRTRSVAAVAAAGLSIAALSVGVLAAPAGAAPARSATTSTDTTYLQDTLGVPANTVIETVTYDRFQWLLQQSGTFAFLVGDPAEDAGFKTQAQAVDSAARAAGVSKVYWFDPNLTGGVKVGSANVPNLDIRNPGAITQLASASQTVYDNAWKNLVGQYLGNGIKATATGVGTESAKVTTTTDATVVNDANAPLYDYSAGTPADALDSTFFVYDKDNVAAGSPDKLVQSVDLDSDANAAADVAAAIGVVGASNIKAIGQFAWWKSEINAKAAAQSVPEDGNPKQYGGAILDDSDDADPWAIQQITFPELVHLLNQNASDAQNFVILFGGTWCPNTRAVIKDVNAQAQQNGVTVYNFDTVLDGGTVGGGTTSATNPLQIRNTANNGGAANANPSFVYGSLLSTYLKNIITQYDLDNGTYVTYYPNGDDTQPIKAVRKLQVPFLIDYQHGSGANPSSTAIKRQWIQQNVDPSTGLPSFKEYMTTWAYTDPTPGDSRLGLSDSQFPVSLPIPGLATFDWRNPVYPDTTSTADAAAYLTPSELQGSDATTLLAQRKSTILNALSNLAFAQEALAKVGYFFGGLPGGVASTQTITAPAVASGTAPTVTVAIANEYGRVPTGTLTLTIDGTSYRQQVTDNGAVFTLPASTAVGSHPFTVSYPGDDQIQAFTRTGTLTVTAAPVTKTAPGAIGGKVKKRPTTKKGGKYKVTVAGTPAPTGSVTLTLTKGKKKVRATGKLAAGVAKVKLPKLAKGKWKVKIAYAGDTTYAGASAKGAAVKITT